MFKIGFSAEVTRDTPSKETHFQETHTITPRKSVVNIHFPARNMTLPFAKAVTWFCAPENEDDEYVSGYDGKAFSLNDLHEMGFSSSVAERGADYYHDNNVVYICVENGSIGHAIVEGSKPYLIEFHYEDGLISDLTCSCFCTGPCKHQFAALLQLKESLDLITKHYKTHFEGSEYFAAISKSAFMNFAVAAKESGSFTLN